MWIDALPPELQGGFIPAEKKPGQAIVRDLNSLIGLMGLGAVFMCRISHNANWLENEVGGSLDISVRNALLTSIIHGGWASLEKLPDGFCRINLTKTGDRRAEKLLGPIEGSEPITEPAEIKKKEEPAKPAVENNRILDHAIGPFAGGYALQVIFDDLEMCIRVAKGMGILKPNLETIKSIVEDKPITASLLRSAPKAVPAFVPARPKSHCASCDKIITNTGPIPKNGIRFCISDRCQREKALFKRNQVAVA